MLLTILWTPIQVSTWSRSLNLERFYYSQIKKACYVIYVIVYTWRYICILVPRRIKREGGPPPPPRLWCQSKKFPELAVVAIQAVYLPVSSIEDASQPRIYLVGSLLNKFRQFSWNQKLIYIPNESRQIYFKLDIFPPPPPHYYF